VTICPELAFAEDRQILSIALADYFRSGLQFGQTLLVYGHFFSVLTCDMKSSRQNSGGEAPVVLIRVQRI
jgi:hypothetical protein